jgi:DNA polymerase-3 subunit delta
MQIYLIASESIRLIDEELKKIINNNTNVETFDLNNLNISDIITEAGYLSMFDDKRIMVVKNAFIFGSDKVSEKNSEILLKYMNNPNENTILIFTYNGKVDMRKKITKLIKEKFKLIDIPKLTSNELVEKIRLISKKDGFTIGMDGINYIMNSCLNNYDLIYNELDKIKLYYEKPCKIELIDIKNIVSKSLEDNNFKFVEAVVNKDLKKAFLLLDELSLLKIEPINLINLLAREYRLMHFVKVLYDDCKNINSISKELKLQNWQTEKLLKNSFNYSYEELENNLLILNECDLEMKTIYFDKYTLLKSYLLKIID